MTRRKTCMPLQWKKKHWYYRILTLALVLYPVPHWGHCKQPLHLPLAIYQLILLITLTWTLLLMIILARVVSYSALKWPFLNLDWRLCGHLILIFPYVKMDAFVQFNWLYLLFASLVNKQTWEQGNGWVVIRKWGNVIFGECVKSFSSLGSM